MAFCIDRWFQQIFLDQSMGASKAVTTTSRAGKVESLSSRCASTAWLNWLLKIAMGDNKLVVFFLVLPHTTCHDRKDSMRDMREELVFFRRKWVSWIRAAAEHHGMQEELFQRPIVREVTCGTRGFAGFAAESPISYANSHVWTSIHLPSANLRSLWKITI